jgi:hypothetical protein
MKRPLKLTLLVTAAALMLGAVAPSYAQESTATGDESYAYVPQNAGSDACATQGGYGRGADYANCY